MHHKSLTNTKAALATLWRLARQPEASLDAVTLTGSEPALPSSFAIGTAAQASIAASALAAAELWRLRTGRQQQVSVEMRDAAIEFRSEHYLRLAESKRSEVWDKIAGLYRCGDGRWVRLHTNFPHHRDGVLKLLGCDYSREAVQRALDGWEAEKFETAAARGRTGRHDDTLLRRMGRARPRQGRRRACRSSRSRRSATRHHSRFPPGDRPLVGRARARPHARDRRPGVRAHARRPRRGRDAGHRRASAADDAAGDGQRARQALDLHRSPRGVGARDAWRPGARRRYFRAGLPARRREAQRLRPGGSGAAAAGHRLRLALRLRPRRPVGEPARLQLAGAERQRHQPRRGRSGGQRSSQSLCRARRSIMRAAT